MPLPIVAVVGRPNVGKSTFVNRIAQADEAIVHEMRGVTRDRSYHEADWNGVDFKLIDTGGIEMGDDDAFQGSIRNQALAGANEADVILFLVDGKTGVNADDEAVARILRKTSKPVFLVVNKLDTPNRMDEVWEFYQLGLGDPWPVSAMHGHGTGDLLDEVVNELKKVDLPADADEEDGINVAIIGRPNAGKSSLTNKLTANDRSIVSDVAGTTRDAIDTHIVHDGQRYTIVDTAGLRRKSQIDEDVEYYGFVRAMRAIDRANVALLVIDSTLGLTDQDQRVAGFAAERGCAMVIVLNKWDLIEGPEAKAEIRAAHEVRHADGYVSAAIHVLREPPRPRGRQLRALPREPLARELRARGYAHQDQVQEEGLGVMGDLLVAAGLFVAAFLLGSIPFGLIISKVFYHTDLREHGSGNIGTTNAIRTMGKVGGYAVFVLDFGKGLLSGVLAWAFSMQFLPGGGLEPGALVTYDTMLAVAFLGCVWGHIFCPWLGFKGGKGIAVAVGCLFVTFGWIGACLELLIFIVLVVATKRVSVGSIAAAAACPFFALYFFWGDWLAWLFCTVAGLTVVWAHRENIKRLRAGTESRIGDKGKKKEA